MVAKYRERLSGFDCQVVVDAFDEVWKDSTWFPTPSEIYRICQSLQKRLDGEKRVAALLDAPRALLSDKQERSEVSQACHDLAARWEGVGLSSNPAAELAAVLEKHGFDEMSRTIKIQFSVTEDDFCQSCGYPKINHGLWNSSCPENYGEKDDSV